MRGYLGMPEATSDAIDAEGWFHTGDIGELDIDGYLRITDRKKDLIKTSGGSTSRRRRSRRAQDHERPDQPVVVIGDRRKYVSVLARSSRTRRRTWRGGGEPASSYRDAASSKAVRAKVQDAIDR